MTMHYINPHLPLPLSLDGTYSTNNCGMPLYAFLAEDGNGRGQIVALFLLSGESMCNIQSMVESFSSANPAIAQTKTVITDKDFSEIAALEAALPHVAVQLCTFHCITAVNRKISTLTEPNETKQNMNSLFRKLIYAKDTDAFNEIATDIESTSQSFHDYLTQNWYSNKQRLVHFLTKSRGKLKPHNHKPLGKSVP